MIAKMMMWAGVVVCLSAASCDKGSGSAGAEGDAANSAASAASAAPKPLKLAVIPKGTSHEFWKTVHAGAAKASQELGVEIAWKGPIVENDLKGQIDVVQNFIAQKVSGIAIAPLNDKGLVSPVQQAGAAKIPVLVFDSDLQGNDYVSFVATDNLAAGRIAGDALANALGGKGSVAMLRYLEGSASTANRENGFLEAMKKYPGIKVVSDNQYAGPSTETAFAKAESLLTSVKAAKGGVQGVYAPNESSAFGMLLALRKVGLAGKIKFVGFDSSTKLVDGLRAGEINGLVVQDPFNMGYLSVKVLVDAIKGNKVESRTDTGAKLVTKENIDTPEMTELLNPDLKKWLKE